MTNKILTISYTDNATGETVLEDITAPASLQSGEQTAEFVRDHFRREINSVVEGDDSSFHIRGVCTIHKHTAILLLLHYPNGSYFGNNVLYTVHAYH